LVRTGRKSTLKFLWSKPPQGINNARISQYRTISNYFFTRASNIAAYPLAKLSTFPGFAPIELEGFYFVNLS